jgi:hypothetical protein
MGNLDDPLDTFWQLVTRRQGSASWRLATPPGVASNGGLVTSIRPAQLTAGFEPSQDLRFSPLLRSTDQGATWTQSSLPGAGLLPAGLTAVPDALAGSSSLGYLALVRTSGGQVLSSPRGQARWTKVTDVAQLASTPVTSTCRVVGLTAVAFAPDGGELVGATCAGGKRVGIFEEMNGHWRSAGPVLAGKKSDPIQVLRLVEDGSSVTALVAAGPPRRRWLSALWSNDGMKSWTASTTLSIAGSRLTSTGLTASGGPIVLLGNGKTQRSAWTTPTRPDAPWLRLATPPAGTSTVAVGPSGTFEALIADRSTLVVEMLSGGRWHRVQSLKVAIQYGSSS